MPAWLRAVAPTLFVTLQDGGRRGWRRFGVAGSGAMDRMALAIANALVGNRPTEPALEFAHAAGTWCVEAASCRVAVAGGSFGIGVDGVAQPPFQSVTLRRGQRLHVRGAADAVWGYLAVAGGFNVAPTFGSRATHLRTGIGGWHGRAVEAGDLLPLRLEHAPDEPDRATEPPPAVSEPCRIVLGPQDDYFPAETLDTLLHEGFTVSRQMDRMAYRLDGPTLAHRDGYNIITDATMPGSIQVPGTGTPIVLMRDAPTVGGYPKIATIVEPDLGRLAQQRPGNTVRFAAVTPAEAHALRRRYLARLQIIAEDLGSPRSAMTRPG